MPNLRETVAALAERARRKHLPNRAELVALAFQLLNDHMDHTENFVTKDGEIASYTRPQRQAANKAFECAAMLALKHEKPEEAAEDMGLKDFVAQVRAAGLQDLLIKELMAPESAPEGTAIQ